MESEYFSVSGSCCCGWQGVELSLPSENWAATSLRRNHDSQHPHCGGTLCAYFTRDCAGQKSHYSADIDAGGSVTRHDQISPAPSASPA